MNRLLDNVVSDITGVTGMAIMRAILAGERDAGRLAALRDRRCRADERVIAGSLEGHYHEEHLFELRQAVERHDFLGRQIEACEAAIRRHLDRLDGGDGGDGGEAAPLPAPRKAKGTRTNRLPVEARARKGGAEGRRVVAGVAISGNEK